MFCKIRVLKQKSKTRLTCLILFHHFAEIKYSKSDNKAKVTPTEEPPSTTNSKESSKYPL